MPKKNLTPRQRERLKNDFPAGRVAALLTGAGVVLVGVFLNLQPSVILVRAFISSCVMGFIVSLGTSVIRMTDADYKRRRRATDT
ncbi:MAG: hypothetical protein AB8B50_19565 [Pirellulaceae bacterium]